MTTKPDELREALDIIDSAESASAEPTAYIR